MDLSDGKVFALVTQTTVPDSIVDAIDHELQMMNSDSLTRDNLLKTTIYCVLQNQGHHWASLEQLRWETKGDATLLTLCHLRIVCRHSSGNGWEYSSPPVVRRPVHLDHQPDGPVSRLNGSNSPTYFN